MAMLWVVLVIPRARSPSDCPLGVTLVKNRLWLDAEDFVGVRAGDDRGDRWGVIMHPVSIDVVVGFSKRCYCDKGRSRANARLRRQLPV